MKKIRKIMVSMIMIVVLCATMVYTFAEIKTVVFSDSVLVEALGSDGGATKANPITVKGKTVEVSYAELKKADVKVSRASAIKVSNAKGTVTYKKVSGSKNLTISKKGAITVKKGLKTGTYKIKVNVRAGGTKTYKAKTKAAIITIKVVK